MEVGEYIIGNLDRDGYLKTSLEETALDTGADRQLVEKVYRKIQKFDPVGVGSQNLSECLLAQAELLPGKNTIVKKILLQHMKYLERKKYPAIAKELNISLKEVLKACEIIAHMEPRPGAAYNDSEPQYITPDIYVYKLDDEYIVSLNEDGQPKLRINSFYKNILLNNSMDSEKAKEYIQEKIRSAVWLIKSIYHRQSTIVNVMKSIIKFQRDFFDYGNNYLKPLVLRDVAEDVEMHESNISRVTTNKYVHTPHGIFELKYFFNSGLTSDNGESIASESVKNKIRSIIEKEDPYNTCSDQEIANILKKKQGINIARRTVTKYREMLGVLSSSKRKKIIW
jgi:RNA polymerase sigma-54 factor